MLRHIASIIILLFLVSKIKSQNENPNLKKNVVCYYANWSPYRTGRAHFTPKEIDPFLCTHLIYAFATFKDGKLAPSDEGQDITHNGFKDFNDLKNVNKNLKTLLSVGGTAEGPARFSKLAESKETIDIFTKSVIDLLRQYNFDGINLDWHYPNGEGGGQPIDKENYVNLVKTLREEFEKEAELTKKPCLMLTICLPSKVNFVEKGYDLLNLQKYVDFFNLLSYDYHELQKGVVSHHSPLYSLPQTAVQENVNLNADASVQYLINNGIMKEKLNLGIPTYGRAFQLENVNDNKLGAKYQNPVNDVGFKTYYDICKVIKEENWTVVEANSTALGPYAYKGKDWISYDDENIARRKGAYVRSKGLAGIMFWTVDNDNFNGDCGKGPFPVIKAAKEGLM